MDSLIAKLEAATEGSRELDGIIAREIGAVPKGEDIIHPISPDLGRFGIGAFDAWDAPHYTTSLDAALTLVPPKYKWMLENWNCTDMPREYGVTLEDDGPDDPITTSAPTIALALCIAAIKARKGGAE